MQASQTGSSDEETPEIQSTAIYCIQDASACWYISENSGSLGPELISLSDKQENRIQRDKNSLSYSVKAKSYIWKTTMDIVKHSIIKTCKLYICGFFKNK